MCWGGSAKACRYFGNITIHRSRGYVTSMDCVARVAGASATSRTLGSRRLLSLQAFDGEHSLCFTRLLRYGEMPSRAKSSLFGDKSKQGYKSRLPRVMREQPYIHD